MGAHRVYEVALTAALCVSAAGPAVHAQNSQTRAARADFETADRSPTDDAALNRLLAGLPQKIFDDHGTPRRYYVWEGDMVLDVDEVQAMMSVHRARQRPVRPGELLLQVRADGQSGVWSRAKRKLTYAVDCSTFPSASLCERTKTGMQIAAQSWQRACRPCGVEFKRLNAPSQPRPTDAAGGPTFVVRYDPNAVDYVAVSFFANDPAYKRYLDVTPGYFTTTTFSRPGILRHELGHVLGYRHEHNRALAGCYFEDRNWVPLTPYDPHSVMHYFCGGGGTLQLQFTQSDVQGHATAYR